MQIILFYRTSMMEGSGSLEQQLEATKVCSIETDTFIIIYVRFVYSLCNYVIYIQIYSEKLKKYVHVVKI